MGQTSVEIEWDSLDDGQLDALERKIASKFMTPPSSG